MNERAATLYVEIVERECASEKHVITTQARQRDSAHKIYVLKIWKQDLAKTLILTSLGKRNFHKNRTGDFLSRGLGEISMS